MADLSITAANVMSGSGAKRVLGTAGATITAGQVVYLDAADNHYKLADANSGTAAARAPYGIALNGAASGQPLEVQVSGPITIGATMTAGLAYYLSNTPGGICPVADLVTGSYPSALGIAQTTTVFDINIEQSGAVL